MHVAIAGITGFGICDSHKISHINYCLGENSGNLLFFNSVRSLFTDSYNYLLKPGGEFEWSKSLREKYDLLLCPMANHLCGQILNPEYVGYLSNADLPILPIGLGAQAESIDDLIRLRQEFQSLPHCKDFISILNERAKCICVRGPTSGKLLSDVGYRNQILITGCPSTTISPDPTLGERLEKNAAAALQAIRQNNSLTYIHNLPQFTQEAIELDFSKQRLIPSVKKTNYLLRHCLDINVQQSLQALNPGARHYTMSETYIEQLGTNGPATHPLVAHVFFSLDSWAERIKNANISLGTRIHGNILATQLGIPALVYVHDERVSELAIQAGIPTITLPQLEAVKDGSELIANCVYRGSQFDALRSANSLLLRKAIEMNGLKPSEKLVNLARQACATEATSVQS